jgi:nitrite reductase/ring-hydroxylating ferredoxin subunit
MASFDHDVVVIRTGAVINGPATEPLNLYEVRDVQGNIQIRA